MNGARDQTGRATGENLSQVTEVDQNSFEVEEKRDIPFPTLVISVFAQSSLWSMLA